MVDQLGMFVKYWQAGAVKTRLARVIGPGTAAALYQQFVRMLIHRFDTVADQRVLAYTPPDRRDAFAAIAGRHWSVAPQAGGDLGSRMRAYFDQALQGRATRVVLIGSDSPTLPEEYLQAAFRSLDQHDVVLGPCPDGGYYLVGASSRCPSIFHDIHWSTPAVFAQTVQRLEQLETSYQVLPSWYDVDQIGDLQRLRHELQHVDWPDSLVGGLRQLVATLGEDS